MKKLICLLMALVMVLSLVPCAFAADDDFDPSEITLTWCSLLINHPVLRTCELGFVEACEELGYKWEIVGTETADYNEVNAAAEAAAAAGSKGMLDWVGDDVAANGVSILANDYGVVVGAPHMKIEEGSVDGLSFSLACEPVTYARAVADFIAERIEGKTGSIAITQATYDRNESLAAESFAERIAELQEEGKLEGVTVLEPVLEGGDDITESTNVNVSVIQAHDDLIAAFSTTGAGPVTWSNAARKCGKEPGELVIVSMDYTADNMAELESGYCAAIVAQPLYDEAYQGVYYLDTILRGGEVDYWTELDAPLVYKGGEGVHDPAHYAGILERVDEMFG